MTDSLSRTPNIGQVRFLGFGHRSGNADDNEVSFAYVTWVDGEYSYKQIEISAVNDKMTQEIAVVTQLYPEFGEGGPPEAPYPPATNLTISGIRIFIWYLFVELDWEAPETSTQIDYYEIYRNGSLWRTSNLTRYYVGTVTGNRSFYVVVVYDDGMRSDPSNTVSTGDL